MTIYELVGNQQQTYLKSVFQSKIIKEWIVLWGVGIKVSRQSRYFKIWIVGKLLTFTAEVNVLLLEKKSEVLPFCLTNVLDFVYLFCQRKGSYLVNNKSMKTKQRSLDSRSNTFSRRFFFRIGSRYSYTNFTVHKRIDDDNEMLSRINSNLTHSQLVTIPSPLFLTRPNDLMTEFMNIDDWAPERWTTSTSVSNGKGDTPLL